MKRRYPALLLGAAMLALGSACPAPTTTTTSDSSADAVSDAPVVDPDANASETSATDANLETSAELPPPPGCDCVHGVCADGGGCTCHPGWEGPLCEALGDIIVPWNAGPYGLGIKDTAEDFTVSLIDEGDVTLSELWTGEDSLLFAIKYGASGYNNEFWNTSVASLFYYTPTNVHIFFGSFDPSYATDMSEMKQRVDAALQMLSADEQAQWVGRIHYIDAQANALPGSVGQFIISHGYFLFGIDRLQRWREVGLLWDLTDDSRPIGYLGNEAVYFNYEAELHWKTQGLERDVATTLDVWTAGDRHNGGWAGGFSSRWDVEFPDADTMAGFDKMAIWLYTACPDHKQGKDAGCNEWDYIQTVFICDDVAQAPDPPAQACTFDGQDGPETTTCDCITPVGDTVEGSRTCLEDGTDFGPCNCGCGTEFARYVTSYGREGEWMTDLSPLLPMVNSGGTKTLRFAGANGYDLQGKIFLWDSGSGRRPTKLTYLWGRQGGTAFNADYNAPETHPPVTFDVTEETTHVELFAVVSGHGHSSTVNGCAEFCNHQHQFTLNGQSFWLEHPTAGTAYGCLERTAEGGVPNQFGTWQLGRAGWCAGMDVKPFTQGMTPLLQPTNNALSYNGLFNYQHYTPIVTDPGGYLPEIKMTSWLVFYEAM